LQGTSPKRKRRVRRSDLVRQSKVHRLKNLRSVSADSQRRPALPLRWESNRQRRETHEKKSASSTRYLEAYKSNRDYGENRESIQSLFPPLPPVQKSQRPSFMPNELTDR